MNALVLSVNGLTPEQAATRVDPKFRTSDNIPFDLLVRAFAEQARVQGSLFFDENRWAEWERPIIREAMNRAWAMHQEAPAMSG